MLLRYTKILIASRQPYSLEPKIRFIKNFKNYCLKAIAL